MIVALLLLAGAAASQRADATIPKRDVVLGLATCVRHRAPDRVRRLLSTEPGSEAEEKMLLGWIDAYGACIADRVALSFQVGLLRGQFAEMSFHDDPGLLDRAAKLAPAAPIPPQQTEIDARVQSVPAPYRDVRWTEQFRVRYAGCLARSAPAAVAGLMPTQQGSAQERAALLEAGDHLMRCMPQGITYHIKPAELRPYLMAALHYAASNVRSGA